MPLNVCILRKEITIEEISDTERSKKVSKSGGIIYKSSFCLNFFRQSQNRGCGTGILFRDSVNDSLVDGKENKSFEYSEWIVKVHDRSMRHIIVYRAPYSSLTFRYILFLPLFSLMNSLSF